MKRLQSPAPDSSSKKPKISAPISEGLSTPAGTFSAHDGEEWTKVEKRKAKKTKKANTKLDNAPPRFMYANGEIQKRSEAVGISGIRDLVLHLVADAPPLGWLRVDNARSVQRVVTVLVPGLTHSLLQLPPLPTSATANPNMPLPVPTADNPCSVPFINKTFSHACPTRAPGEQMRMHSIISEFFQLPVTGEEKKRRLEERLSSERSIEKTPERYVVSLEDMVENDYPIPSYMADVFEKPLGWMETPAPTEGLAGSAEKLQVLAIDCEMCLTEDGNELARVCVIDFTSGKVVYDQLVKPQKPIIDYLTRWSGITKEALAPVTTTHAEVQAHILSLLSVTPTPILLGHSLESDLKALKICHPRVIDTALIYNHPRGRPLKPGLAWLARKWLGRTIQNRGEGGHDPKEDAQACLDLLKKKLANGPGFGEFKTDYESIFDRMRRARGGTIKAAVVDHGNPSVMHGAKAARAVSCKTDDDVLQAAVEAIPGHQYIFARFTELAELSGWITAKPSPDNPAPMVAALPTTEVSTPQPIITPDLGPALTSLNERLSTLHAALPSRTALILFTGHGDPRTMAALNARKGAFDQALRMGVSPGDLTEGQKWTNADVRQLEEAVELARRGLLFLCIKT